MGDHHWACHCIECSGGTIERRVPHAPVRTEAELIAGKSWVKQIAGDLLRVDEQKRA